jgi:hypothetical protein
MLPGRIALLSRARTRDLRGGRGCAVGGAAIRLFAQASNHSSTAVTLTIHRPPINDALRSPFLIARLTVRSGAHIAPSLLLPGRSGTDCSRRHLPAQVRNLLWLVKHQISQLRKGPINLPRCSDGKIGVSGGQCCTGPSAVVCSSLQIKSSSSPATLLASRTASRTPSASSAVRRR